MKKARTLLIIAIWVAILPYLGFPYFWKNIISLATGIAIAYISYIIYREVKPKEPIHKKSFDSFSENIHRKYSNKNVDIVQNQNANINADENIETEKIVSDEINEQEQN